MVNVNYCNVNENEQTWLYCHFIKIIKVPETNIQSTALSQKHVFYKNKNKKLDIFENETLPFLQIKEIINYTSGVNLWEKIVLWWR